MLEATVTVRQLSRRLSTKHACYSTHSLTHLGRRYRRLSNESTKTMPQNNTHFISFSFYSLE